MPVVPFIPAIIGAGTAIYSASQGNKAVDRTLEANNNATAANTALQREQWDRAETLNSPYIQAGNSALPALTASLGLGPGGGGGAPAYGSLPTPDERRASGGVNGGGSGGGAPAGGQAGGAAPANQDWGAYRAAHPDVQAGYDAYKGGSASGFGGTNEGQNWQDWGYAPNLTEDQFAQTFQEKTGAGQGYTVPTSAAGPAGPGAPAVPGAVSLPNTQRPDQLAPPPAQRPAEQPVPTFQRPADIAAPTYTRPDQGQFKDPGEIAGFSFDPKSVYDDPGYKFRLNESIAGVNNKFAARGLLQSGFAAKGVIDRASDVASQEYGNAFNRALQSYGANAQTQAQNRSFARNVFQDDRNNTNDNFENDRTATTGEYRYGQNRADTNFAGDRTYGTNLFLDQQDRGDRQFTDDRAYNTNLWQYQNDQNQGNFERDRTYNADRYDTGINNLFNLTNVGRGAVQNVTSAGSNYANNVGNINDSRATAIGDAANARAGNNASAVGAVGGAVVGAYNWGGNNNPNAPRRVF